MLPRQKSMAQLSSSSSSTSSWRSDVTQASCRRPTWRVSRHVAGPGRAGQAAVPGDSATSPAPRSPTNRRTDAVDIALTKPISDRGTRLSRAEFWGGHEELLSNATRRRQLMRSAAAADLWHSDRHHTDDDAYSHSFTVALPEHT